MHYKPDWQEAAQRWTALWEGRCGGRPCIAVTAPRGKRTGPERPAPPARDLVSGWLDPAHIIPAMLNGFESTFWGGEAYPSPYLLGGWVTMDCGAGFAFPEDYSTIWFNRAKLDFDRPPNLGFDPENPWLRRYEALHGACVEAAGEDGFLVGQVTALPGNDVLPLLLGTQEFLTALLDHPLWMRSALGQLAEKHARVMEHFFALTRAVCRYWYGIAGWAHFWAPEPFLVAQSDVSCMLSPDMFAEFVLPELDLLGKRFGRLWYHLDGPAARRHLPTLLSRDYLRVIQFTPGEGQSPNGPAWLDIYKEIQAAGRIVWLGLPPENIEPLIRLLDPALLCFQTQTRTEGEARELLSAAERWTKTWRASH